MNTKSQCMLDLHVTLLTLSTVARLDNLLSSNALFILAYFGLTNSFLQNTLTGYIKYSIPIALIVIIGVSLFNAVVISITTYFTRKRTNQCLRRLEIPTPPEPLTIFLATMSIRSVVIPICLGLIWDFILLDFHGGKVYYIITFTVIAYVVAGLFGVVYAVAILKTNRR
ncbi:Hypothetical protein GSB_10425 [Giardia duodenalis]|uniref:Uncharacterized protein n=2 Tax=Giardia intestinalis TaxID=5741 RepID=V6TQP6_GIAIN|nr:Hypothetical protein GSB_10425 [Giardia intestinalis]